jgi:RimJ/RimL family protein N-acetyltransferase
MAAITSSTERVLMDARDYRQSETLKDGTPVTVRSIRAEDGESVLDAFHGMDKESVYRRFFSPKKELSPKELEQLTDVDFNNVVALVLTKTSAEGEILIGGGRYAMEGPDATEAEIAFMTNGNYRGLGIASLVLKHLVQIAREAGLMRFEAEVLAENQPMIAVFRRSGLPMRLKRDGGTFHVTLSLRAEPTPVTK